MHKGKSPAIRYESGECDLDRRGRGVNHYNNEQGRGHEGQGRSHSRSRSRERGRTHNRAQSDGALERSHSESLARRKEAGNARSSSSSKRDHSPSLKERSNKRRRHRGERGSGIRLPPPGETPEQKEQRLRAALIQTMVQSKESNQPFKSQPAAATSVARSSRLPSSLVARLNFRRKNSKVGAGLAPVDKFVVTICSGGKTVDSV